jgi:Uma2 family endonuclease
MTMETTSLPKPTSVEPIPPLTHGDRLSREEFERRYDAMPEVKKAELLEGVVFMPSPVSNDHAGPHSDIVTFLGLYSWFTSGVLGSDNGSVRLGSDSEPQPDAFLRILETHGGQSRLSPDRLVEGAPELAVEVAVTSLRVDRDIKLPLYRRCGVKEALLWRVEAGELDWFVLRGDAYQQLAPGSDGVLRSETFPGLWLDVAALLRGDMPTVARVLQQGLASPEHSDFVQRLGQIAAGR